ncbi:hypothetical protein [Microbacterium sp.]|uniref:hypothetical protein n=1 Tax=Microbacterium sp. TaxID=51671 RepID=UPI003C786836
MALANAQQLSAHGIPLPGAPALAEEAEPGAPTPAHVEILRLQVALDTAKQQVNRWRTQCLNVAATLTNQHQPKENT